MLGELSEFKVYGSGHAYFTLKDASAALNCVMFSSNYATVPFTPHAGEQVVLSGSLDIYKKNGKFQMIVRTMQLVGAGAEGTDAKALRARLEAEGLFAAARKVPLPSNIRHVAVVTSPAGAVIHDILSVLDRRCGGLHVTIYPCAVQGAAAPKEIAAALEASYTSGADCVILARGGGSAEDLSAFNTELIARAIAARPASLPVISAVGHETDFTLSDDVADARAPTPSSAAEMISRDAQAGETFLQQARGALRAWEIRVKYRRIQLDAQCAQLEAWSAENSRITVRFVSDGQPITSAHHPDLAWGRPIVIKFPDGEIEATPT